LFSAWAKRSAAKAGATSLPEKTAREKLSAGTRMECPGRPKIKKLRSLKGNESAFSFFVAVEFMEMNKTLSCCFDRLQRKQESPPQYHMRRTRLQLLQPITNNE
jgi:hypothetical protein